MPVAAKIVVTLDDQGRVHVEAPLAHKALCLSMLEKAARLVQDAKAPGLILPRGVRPVLNGHG
jgi:hypothetical protein